ncbi:DUF1194 domain-containing protein [Aminobacter sp. AP02]|uniref:DUF1194 domain-containing protein n=1 Tax=Aminobacter sp. AP02 TaxID=2135737 RepID=UPI000D6DA421|nr:DUF1194 domain-containing protein [Aminobacter sp. AP02]PWK68535.1 uncharacterized protein DUF1194 [Aminobacter sp. AP02]
MATKRSEYRLIVLCMTLLQALLLVPPGNTRAADRPADHTTVDVAIVLAADVSASMTEEELEFQRIGYAEALRSIDVLTAIRTGYAGRIAVTYVEWSGNGSARVVVNWTVIDNSTSVAEVAETIRSFTSIPSRRGGGARTSISHALRFGVAQFSKLPWAATRHVIDISGDGINNDGGPVEAARDLALDAGIAINGLPIGNDSNSGEPISAYYARAVIGGENAFIEPAASIRDFQIALQRKLQREIANLDGMSTKAASITPAQGASSQHATMERLARHGAARDDG